MAVYPNSTELKGGEAAIVSIDIKNPSRTRVFSEIVIDMSSYMEGATGQAKLLVNLKPNQSINVMKKEFIAPEVSNKTKFTISASAKFKSGREDMESSGLVNISVIPSGRIIVPKDTTKTQATKEKTSVQEPEQKTTITGRLNETTTKNYCMYIYCDDSFGRCGYVY